MLNHDPHADGSTASRMARTVSLSRSTAPSDGQRLEQEDFLKSAFLSLVVRPLPLVAIGATLTVAALIIKKMH